MRSLPIRLCYSPAFIFIASNNHDRLVFVLVHVGERCVALYEHTGVERYTQLLAEVRHPLRLVFTAAICEEDERYALRLEIGQGIVGARQSV
jgi:hypothetical protein